MKQYISKDVISVAMKSFVETIFDIIAQYLMWTCDLTHMLPDPYEEKLQVKIFIRFIGYHCPFATWAFMIDEKFGSNRWLVKK